jgi:hypothetical protein
MYFFYKTFTSGTNLIFNLKNNGLKYNYLYWVWLLDEKKWLAIYPDIKQEITPLAE